VDLDVDLTDYLTLNQHLHTNVSALTEQQAYQLGDMTRDRQIDIYDFVEFELAFDDANGVGAFVAMLAAAPEPPSGTLGALACMGLFFCRGPSVSRQIGRHAGRR
jgi:hypothetical protein